MSDPAKYRTRDEVDQYRKQRDPILQIRDTIIRNGGKETELNKIDNKIKDIVKNASNFALESDFPSESELFTDILL